MNYNQLGKVVSLSPDGSRFQFISGGLFQLSFGLFQKPKQQIEILLNNNVIASNAKNNLKMVKVGNQSMRKYQSGSENSHLKLNVQILKENRENNKLGKENKKLKDKMKYIGVTFEDYYIIEFGSWLGVRLMAEPETLGAEAFIRIVKI